jgi:hypothetical protein
MRRLLSVLTVTAMLLMTLLAGPAVGQILDPDAGGQVDAGEPVIQGDCDWYGPFDEPPPPHWEYWCYSPDSGWEHVYSLRA